MVPRSLIALGALAISYVSAYDHLVFPEQKILARRGLDEEFDIVDAREAHPDPDADPIATDPPIQDHSEALPSTSNVQPDDSIPEFLTHLAHPCPHLVPVFYSFGVTSVAHLDALCSEQQACEDLRVHLKQYDGTPFEWSLIKGALQRRKDRIRLLEEEDDFELLLA